MLWASYGFGGGPAKRVAAARVLDGAGLAEKAAPLCPVDDNTAAPAATGADTDAGAVGAGVLSFPQGKSVAVVLELKFSSSPILSQTSLIGYLLMIGA